MVVAIDGPAGAGKSSLARRVSKSFGFLNLNSGAFYRAIAVKIHNSGLDIKHMPEVISAAKIARIELNGESIYLDGENIDKFLRTDLIDRWSSVISTVPSVRHIVNQQLRQISTSIDIVAEGRDMTTVVFPNAELKIYLDAAPRIRARRRFAQGTSSQSVEELELSLWERDSRDKNKIEGSLKIAEDAVAIDSSDLTLEEVYEKVKGLIDARLSKPSGVDMPEPDAFAQESDQDQLQESYLKALDQLEEGGLIRGRVIQVDGEYVYLDLGLKSDGKVPIEEFKEVPAIGDTVETVLIKREGRHGEVIISKNKADLKVFWKTLREALSSGEPVNGRIVKTVKGGFEVNLGHGIHGFCPISKIDVQRIDNPEKYVGLESPFIIDRLYSEKKVNIVLTRRLYLERLSEKNRAEFFNTVSIGDTVEGYIKSFTSFGSFVDLGGFDGLLHMNDMSWGHVTRPRDYVKKGQKIELKVIRLDPEGKKINLSLKHFQPDPWSTFEEKYHVNQIITGRITRLTDFGAFIEIEEGIEGLAHISELSWVKHVKHPKELLEVGNECEAMILGYDIPQGRISLGLKQVLPNPWEDIASRYAVGTRGKWIVKKITNAGAFVELEEGIDAFLHAEDLSWTRKSRNVGAVLTENEPIDAVIISINTEERRIRIGVKQLKEDPWIKFRDKFPQSSVVEGEIIHKTDFGLFVRVEGDIEGLIHKSNLMESKGENPDEKLASYNIGDKLRAVVTEINPSKQKLSLSVRELRYREERAEISRYMDGKGRGGDSYTLADMLEDKQDS